MSYNFYTDVTATGPADEIARFKQMWFEHALPDDRVFRDEPSCFDCRFDTSYVPIEILKDLGERFSSLNFSLEGCDPLAGIAFRGAIKDGKLALRKVPLIYETAKGVTVSCLEGTGNGGSYRIGE